MPKEGLVGTNSAPGQKAKGEVTWPSQAHTHAPSHAPPCLWLNAQVWTNSGEAGGRGAGTTSTLPTEQTRQLVTERCQLRYTKESLHMSLRVGPWRCTHDKWTYPAEGRKEGLLPPGPCSQCSYCDPSGWGRTGSCSAGREEARSPEGALCAPARQSPGWGSLRARGPRGQPASVMALCGDVGGSGRGAAVLPALPPASQGAERCQSMAREWDSGAQGERRPEVGGGPGRGGGGLRTPPGDREWWIISGSLEDRGCHGFHHHHRHPRWKTKRKKKTTKNGNNVVLHFCSLIL